MYSIAYVVPYFGKFPKGFQFWLLSCNVEHQIKCTKKIKLNAKRNNVKFHSIQFI